MPWRAAGRARQARPLRGEARGRVALRVLADTQAPRRGVGCAPRGRPRAHPATGSAGRGGTSLQTSRLPRRRWPCSPPGSRRLHTPHSGALPPAAY
eukprot:6928286-Prymnesium_polylepis.1